MRIGALDVLACPSCLSPLEPEADATDVDTGVLTCRTSSHEFPVKYGIPQLIRPERRGMVEQVAQEFSRTWQLDGWAATDPAQIRNLPSCGLTGRHKVEWRVKARSLRAILPVIDAAQANRIADLGAGIGWLSHRLAFLAGEVFAVDILQDQALGLGAARAFVATGPYFERILGELESLPFQSGSFDIVVWNASLHHANAVEQAVGEGARILRRGGMAILMNSPVYDDEKSRAETEAQFRQRLRALGGGSAFPETYHHFRRDNIERVLAEAVGPVGEIPFDPGRLFRLTREAKGLLLGTELASFPILVARRC